MNTITKATDWSLLVATARDFLPLLGVVIGALLHHFFTRTSEARREKRTMRVEAYSDYLRCIGEAESTRILADPARKADIFARSIAAKVRVCAYGSAAVVTALSKFESAPGLVMSEEKKKYLVGFLDAVRKDCGADKIVAGTEAIQAILFDEK